MSDGCGWASSSADAAASLPPIAQLQTWVLRPQAVATCTVSDVYSLHALEERTGDVQIGSRELFLLNRVPCKMVELVGWVAGVEEKEASTIITLDDGDGECVLPVTYRLPLVTAPKPKAAAAAPPILAPQEERTSTSRCTFKMAQERKAARQAAARARAALEAEAEAESAAAGKMPSRRYYRKDIRVGDVVRVIGKVDEWARNKPTGKEWVRGITVEEGAGGVVEVVDPDEQYLHMARVLELHQTTYCRPFKLPPSARFTPVLDESLPTASVSARSSHSMSLYSDGMETQSEMPSELTIGDDGDSALPDIRKLRSSQLNENTFRRYLLDHMTEEVRSAVLEAEVYGTACLDRSLHRLFPEYAQCIKGNGYGKGKERQRPILATITQPNSAYNPSIAVDIDPDQTPRSYSKVRPALALAPMPVAIPTCTIPSLLAVPHLAELASMVVEAETKKEERRRRRRIRDGEARDRDLAIEAERRAQGKGKSEWRLGPEAARKAMERLVNWGLRAISEEGSLVEIQRVSMDNPGQPRLSSPSITPAALETTAYISLPPPLILPLLLHHLRAEQALRAKVFMTRTDPRRGNGMTITELTGKMRQWGEEGRWERLGEWRVEEGVQWGLIKGRIERYGQGYRAVDGGLDT